MLTNTDQCLSKFWNRSKIPLNRHWSVLLKDKSLGWGRVRWASLISRKDYWSALGIDRGSPEILLRPALASDYPTLSEAIGFNTELYSFDNNICAGFSHHLLGIMTAQVVVIKATITVFSTVFNKAVLLHPASAEGVIVICFRKMVYGTRLAILTGSTIVKNYCHYLRYTWFTPPPLGPFSSWLKTYSGVSGFLWECSIYFEAPFWKTSPLINQTFSACVACWSVLLFVETLHPHAGMQKFRCANSFYLFLLFPQSSTLAKYRERYYMHGASFNTELPIFLQSCNLRQRLKATSIHLHSNFHSCSKPLQKTGFSLF